MRDGEPLHLLATATSHYQILVIRSYIRPTAELYLFNLNDSIPNFPLPLLPGDTQPIVDLQTLVNKLYEQLGYEYFIDYSDRPPLPWSVDDVMPCMKKECYE